MAISKERKEELLKTYAELINKSEGMVLIEYRGLNMKGMGPLRRPAARGLGRAARGQEHVGPAGAEAAPGARRRPSC